MKTVAIVGVGLIGGSFGLALRQAGFNGEIIGVSSARAVQAGLRAGAISTVATLQEAATRADLIYLAQPVDRILETLESLGPIAPPGCLITDAGSTKAAIVRKAALHVRAAAFVGGHPVSGKELRGVEAAEAGLFRNRPYVLTPLDPADSEALQEFRSWLQRIGAHVVEMTPEHHDATVAFTSHLPQLLSSALAVTLARQPNPNVQRIFGAGLLDMTRLALSSSELWLSILETNKHAVAEALESAIKVLVEVKDAFDRENLMNLLDSGRVFASTLRAAQHVLPEDSSTPPGTFPY
jgi:prephenate dehydrogenase